MIPPIRAGRLLMLLSAIGLVDIPVRRVRSQVIGPEDLSPEPIRSRDYIPDNELPAGPIPYHPIQKYLRKLKGGKFEGEVKPKGKSKPSRAVRKKMKGRAR